MGKSAGDDCWMDLRLHIQRRSGDSELRKQLSTARFDRLMAYRKVDFENQQTLDKAWRAICKNALHSDAAIAVFLGLPDDLEVQQFTGMFGGKKVLDPASQRERYLDMAKHVEKLIEFFATTSANDPFEQLITDQDCSEGWQERLPKTKGAELIHAHAEEARKYWQHGMGHIIKPSLGWLYHAFKGANSYKWYLTKQPQATDAGQQTCAALVANLTRYLAKPQHEALAVLGNANFPAADLTNEKIRSAWRPPPWWTEITKAEAVRKKKAG